MRTCYKRCKYCASIMSRWQASKRRGTEDKTGVCRKCKGSRGEARRVAAIFFPNRELNDELIRKIRRQLEANEETEQRQWSETKKRARALLRERKKMCRDKFIGKEVRFVRDNSGWSNTTYEGRGTVEDVRIRDGQIEYVFAENGQTVKRPRLREFEIVGDESTAVA